QRPDGWCWGGAGRGRLWRQSCAVIILALIRPVTSGNVANRIYNGDWIGCLEHFGAANRARRITRARDGDLDDDAVGSGAFRLARSRRTGAAVYGAPNICRRR